MLYLLHFDPKYRHAGHYLGYTQDLPKRFALHLQGKGSPLVKAAIRHGSRITLVRIWAGDGNAERDIKRQHSSVRLCPACDGRATGKMKVHKSVLVRLRTAEEVRRSLASVTASLRKR
jgi:predicted GIY-YIG superfamily endonuclease